MWICLVGLSGESVFIVDLSCASVLCVGLVDLSSGSVLWICLFVEIFAGPPAAGRRVHVSPVSCVDLSCGSV